MNYLINIVNSDFSITVQYPSHTEVSEGFLLLYDYHSFFGIEEVRCFS